VLVAIDEHRNISWRFAPYESYAAWLQFLVSLPIPEVVVMDGQKGLFAAAKRLWPDVLIQRCQFHVISLAFQYMGRRPKDEAGQEMAKLLYALKTVRTRESKNQWLLLYKIWEKRYDYKVFSVRNEYGKFMYQRLRSVRFIMRKAIPYLFTYIDKPGVPNTTNLVEGWVNSAIAEALRLHRGLRLNEKKMLVSVILAKITEKNLAKNIR
jgi:transposase-like protein